jgi:hypothetical protein
MEARYRAILQILQYACSGLGALGVVAAQITIN